MEDFKLFKKIFDLDPREVQEFVKADADSQYRKYEDALDPKDYKIIVEWAPWCNEFYAYVEPNLKWSEGKYTFNDKDLSLQEYLDIHFTHFHYDFAEVYGKMSGETTLMDEIGYCDDTDIDRGYSIIYQKDYVEVACLKNGNWKLIKWDSEKDANVRYEMPEDLMKYITDWNL